MRSSKFALALVLCAAIGCGGGGDGGSGTTNPPPPAAVSSVSLNTSAALLKPTESTVITATAKDANGNTLTGRTVDWSVLPTSGTASIAPNGSSVTVTGTANGQATVKATVEQKTAQAQITVTSTIGSSADVGVGAGGALAFSPDHVDITSGGMVNFTWSGVTHSVTFVNPPGSVASITDRSSGTVPVTFNTTGTYNYHCTIHPGMDCVVTVHIP